MDPDLVFLVTYECPRCHVSLESRASGPPSWLRCPNCNRASLTPEHVQYSAPKIDDQTFEIGPELVSVAALPIRPRAMAPMPRASIPQGQANRVAIGIGFFISTVFFLFSLLDGSDIRRTVFGIAAVFFLYLLARPKISWLRR